MCLGQSGHVPLGTLGIGGGGLYRIELPAVTVGVVLGSVFLQPALMGQPPIIGGRRQPTAGPMAQLGRLESQLVSSPVIIELVSTPC